MIVARLTTRHSPERASARGSSCSSHSFCALDVPERTPSPQLLAAVPQTYAFSPPFKMRYVLTGNVPTSMKSVKLNYDEILCYTERMIRRLTILLLLFLILAPIFGLAQAPTPVPTFPLQPGTVEGTINDT